LGGMRYLVPEFSRNRRNGRHSNILRPLQAWAISGRERLRPPDQAWGTPPGCSPASPTLACWHGWAPKRPGQ
jgi:hypothetical protein